VGPVLESEIIMPLVVAGVLCALLPLVLAVTMYRSRLRKLAKLVALASEGNGHEARVIARSAGGALRPVIEALSGSQEPIAAPIAIREIVLAILALGPAVVLPLYGLSAIEGAEGPQIAPAVSALASGAAMLTPICLASCVIILEIGARASRAVRNACVTLIVQPKTVRGATGEIPRAKLREEAR
jgi:hypothetical protein